MQVNGKEFGKDLVVIAECGSTHQGDINKAIKCVDAAIDSGADAIKMIMSDASELIADKSIKYEGKSLYDTIKSYELTDDEWRKIGAYCRKKKFPFYVSVGTENYIDLAVEVGSFCIKNGGWDTRSFFMIEKAIESGLPLQFDLGAVIVGEVDNLIRYIRERSDVDISLVYESHGELNMLSIPYLRKTYKDIPIGFSSDNRCITPDKIAILYGASSIEKRIKPDSMPGHHRSKALDPTEFKNWVKEIRKLEDNRGNIKIKDEDKCLLGREGLFPSLKDMQHKNLYFTSLCYSKDMKKGDVIDRSKLCAKRPGNGISPYYSYLWEGKKLTKDVKKDTICELVHV